MGRKCPAKCWIRLVDSSGGFNLTTKTVKVGGAKSLKSDWYGAVCTVIRVGEER